MLLINTKIDLTFFTVLAKISFVQAGSAIHFLSLVFSV